LDEHDGKPDCPAVACAINGGVFYRRRHHPSGDRHQPDGQQRRNAAVFWPHEPMGVDAQCLQTAGGTRDTRQAVQKYRYCFAVVFVVGVLYAVFGLLTQFDIRGVIRVFGLEYFRADFAAWVVDGARWVLVVGNLAGVVLGLLLALSPSTVVKLEARGSHWYSERQMTKGANSPNLGLDSWVAAHSGLAGGGIVVFALALIGAFGLMLPRVG